MLQQNTQTHKGVFHPSTKKHHPQRSISPEEYPLLRGCIKKPQSYIWNHFRRKFEEFVHQDEGPQKIGGSGPWSWMQWNWIPWTHSMHWTLNLQDVPIVPWSYWNGENQDLQPGRLTARSWKYLKIGRFDFPTFIIRDDDFLRFQPFIFRGSTSQVFLIFLLGSTSISGFSPIGSEIWDSQPLQLRIWENTYVTK